MSQPLTSLYIGGFIASCAQYSHYKINSWNWNYAFIFHFRTGILRVEDRIVAINGINVMTYSVKAARQLISKSDKVDIIIEYDIAVMGEKYT